MQNSRLFPCERAGIPQQLYEELLEYFCLSSSAENASLNGLKNLIEKLINEQLHSVNRHAGYLNYSYTLSIKHNVQYIMYMLP